LGRDDEREVQTSETLIEGAITRLLRRWLAANVACRRWVSASSITHRSARLGAIAWTRQPALAAEQLILHIKLRPVPPVTLIVATVAFFAQSGSVTPVLMYT
jgi:hypothetical protein